MLEIWKALINKWAWKLLESLGKLLLVRKDNGQGPGVTDNMVIFPKLKTVFYVFNGSTLKSVSHIQSI